MPKRDIMNKTNSLKKAINKTADFIYNNRFFILTVVFLAIMCLAPLKLMATTKGHDFGFHLQRTQALAEEISKGNYFPRIYSNIFGGNGYATPLFYGDLFMMIPALMVAWFEVPLVDAHAYFVAILFVASTLSMYFCTYSVTGSKRAGFCGAMMYGLSSYMVTDLIIRSALGEAQAFVFLPVAFAGLYHILYGKIHKWYLLALGLAGMVYCHLLSSVVTVVTLFLFLLLSVKQIKENPKRLIWIGVSAAVFVGLTANFMFPMLEQMASGTFLATDGYSATKFGLLSERAMPWWALFYDNATNLKLSDVFIPNGMGVAGLVFAGIYVYNFKKYRDGLVTKLLILAGFTLFMTSSFFPWDWFQDVAGVLQFPWRLLVFPTFFLAWAAAKYFAEEPASEETSADGEGESKVIEKSENTPPKARKTGEISMLMYVVVALSLCSYVMGGVGHFNTYTRCKLLDTKIDYIYENRVGAAEYLPSYEDLSEDPLYVTKYKSALIKLKDTVFTDGNPAYLEMNREGTKLVVQYRKMNKDDAYIEVPLLMYRGYTAVTDDGERLECCYGTFNRIRVNVGDRRDGSVTFEYTGTTVQKLSGFISIASLVALAGYVVWSTLRRREEEKRTNRVQELKSTSEE